MKILLLAGALALALIAGVPARPLDDLRWQRDFAYSASPYEVAKIGLSHEPIQLALASPR